MNLKPVPSAPTTQKASGRHHSPHINPENFGKTQNQYNFFSS